MSGALTPGEGITWAASISFLYWRCNTSHYNCIEIHVGLHHEPKANISNDQSASRQNVIAPHIPKKKKREKKQTEANINK